MKNKYSLVAVIFLLASLFTVSSCVPVVIERDYDRNPDQGQSFVFAGQWHGDFGMFYNYVYQGRKYTFDSYDTDIVFYPQYNGATYGWGKQVDFYEYGPYEYMYNRFDWEIRNGVVYLRYYNDSSLDADIYDYRMTADRFTGRFGNSSSTFSLYKIADYYNWNYYTDNYYYYDRPNWYIGFTFNGARNMVGCDSIAADSMSDNVDAEDGVVGYGRRK